MSSNYSSAPGGKKEVFSYLGKRVLVTGGGRGIGRSIAMKMAEQGADVGLAARTEEELQAVAAEIRSLERQAWTFKADLVDVAQTNRLMDDAVAAMGKLDVLINNAGGASSIPGGVGPLLDMTPAACDALYGLNLRSPFLLMQRAAAHMATSNGGAILNVVSIDGLFPAPVEGVYGSAKAALISLTQCAAVEWGQYGVRVNAVAPSLIETQLTRMRLIRNEDDRVGRASFYPINRLGKPEDVAAAAVYLCSDEAEWVSGVTLLVAGGQQTTMDLVRWVRSHNTVPDAMRI